MGSLRQVLKITAVRLTVIYTLLFGVMAFGLIFYISYNTGQLIISQIRVAAQEEIEELANVYQSGGARLLISSIDRRARNPDAYLYLVSDQNGRIIAGNVKSVDTPLLTTGGWSSAPFKYSPLNSPNGKKRQAIAQVFGLQGGLRILVGRDIGDAVKFKTVIGRALTLALGLMLLTGLILWFVIGRRALKRIDDVSKSSSRILAGDLSQRLPVTGAGDEFDRLSDNLNLMLERVEMLNVGVRNMADSIAHDLKTPLTRLRNRAEQARMSGEKSHKENRETLLRIEQDADGLIAVFNSLLMISQVSSGARPAVLTMADSGNILRDVFELFEPAAEEVGIKLKLDVSENLNIPVNRDLIAQAINNLLENALKYGNTASLPEIILFARRKGENILIGVSDNGVGIPDDDLDRVRERFVRLDESRSKPGTGLGLALVDAVAKMHDAVLILKNNNPGLHVELVFKNTAEF